MRREIHAFDFAIVEFVSALDRLFRSTVNPTGLKIAGGLNVEMEKHLPTEVRVRIRPASWPTTSWIYVRFQKNYIEGEGPWKAFEGNLVARHLPQEFSEFAFECRWDSDGYYRFRGRGTDDERTLRQILIAKAAAKPNL